MRGYFGKPRDVPAWEHLQRLPTPVGEPCGWCAEKIVEDDDGVIIPAVRANGTVENQPWHGDCWVRQAIGGVNHWRRKCKCFGGTEPPDPPDVPLRQSASEAVQLLQQIGHCDLDQRG